jgi:hypothetical protein
LDDARLLAAYAAAGAHDYELMGELLGTDFAEVAK